MKEVCYFCGQRFADANAKNEHILDHFERKRCSGCDNELISIGHAWYQLHNDVACNGIKAEPIEPDHTTMAVHSVAADTEYGNNTAIAQQLDPCTDIDQMCGFSVKSEATEILDATETTANVVAPLAVDTDPLADVALDSNAPPQSWPSIESRLSEDCDTEPQQYTCEMCQRTLSSERSLRRHKVHCAQKIAEANGLVEPMAADKCDTQRAEWDAQQQEETVPDSDDDSGRTPDAAGANSGCEYNASAWACTVCSKLFNWAHNAGHHLRVVHQSTDPGHVQLVADVRSRWYCSLCFATFADLQLLHRHLIEVHDRIDQTLARPIHDWRHPDQATLDNGQRLSCEFCRTPFTATDALHSHMRDRHMDELRYRRYAMCGQCPGVFKKQCLHQSHSITVHGTLDQQYLTKYECVVCAASFRRPHTLMAHLPKHGPSDEYVCCIEPCDERFDTIKRLHAHLKNHMGIYGDRCQCETCGKEFTGQFVRYHRCVPATAECVDGNAFDQSGIGERGESATAHQSDNATKAMHSLPMAATGKDTATVTELDPYTTIEFGVKKECDPFSMTIEDVPDGVAPSVGNHAAQVDKPERDDAEEAAPDKRGSSGAKICQLEYGVIKWACGVCLKHFKWEQNAYKHLRLVHGSSDRTMIRQANETGTMWYCGVCSTTFRYRPEAQRHFGIYHLDSGSAASTHASQAQSPAPLASSEVSCDYCLKSFPDKKALSSHMTNPHTNHHIKCAQCPAILHGRNLHQIHSIKEHGTLDNADERWECVMCSQSYHTLNGLIAHLPKHGPADTYVCCHESCAARFDSIQGLHLHMLEHAPATERQGKTKGAQSKLRPRPSERGRMELRADMADEQTEVADHADHADQNEVDNLGPHETSADQFTAAADTHRAKYEANVWNCGACAMQFKWERNAHKHIRLMHGSAADVSVALAKRVRSSWYCSVCLTSFAIRDKLRRHFRQAHNVDDKTLIRPIQGWQDPSQLRPRDGQTVACEYCWVVFEDRRSLNGHKREWHADRLDADALIKCQKCPALFAEQNAHKIHSMQMHGAIESEYLDECECVVCGDVVSGPRRLVAHLTQHGPMAGYPCCVDSCDAQFESLKLLQHHLLRHKGQRTKQRKCRQCQKTYGALAFAGHHCTPATFCCEFCGKQFPERKRLVAHVKLHTSVYKCDHCPKEFRSAKVLRLHVRTHTGEKPYQCPEPECGRAFAQYIDRHRHLYKAHGIFRKKFPCTRCDRIFPENSLLRKHMAAHE